MHIAYDYDPAVHKIIERPEVKFLRRELKRDNLVMYKHWYTGGWVVSFKARNDDGKMQLLDIGVFASDEAGQPVAGQKEIQAIIKRMNTLISSVDALKLLKAREKEDHNLQLGKQDRLDDAHKTIYKELKKRKGPVLADEYAKLHPSIPMRKKEDRMIMV